MLWTSILLSLALLLTTPTTAFPLGGHHGPRPPHHGPTCLDLNQIHYDSYMIYSTPSHLAVYGGTIQFNVSNPAVPVYYEVLGPSESPKGATGETTFTYSRPGNVFAVNQTYTVHGKKFLATGTAGANLTCQTVFWQNPNWTIGELYTTTDVHCGPNELKLPVKVTGLWNLLRRLSRENGKGKIV
ncbi:hypothetical protein BDV96DRAFT_607927 [Lophiotrema nucula]|uniref:AA1-like domain-containing protein n=1 Tax=Lophiotrema nucula TaxID=690887 RepID=A0A6A5YFY8_9PLEO|nr:hypothetical protein BDV96DRAFT_607927 [Lophiotrema nucula]